MSTPEGIINLDSEFDVYVEHTTAHWQVPGVLVIAVKTGAAPFIRGYGSRLPDSFSAIDAETLVQIASNTKPITGIALGLLVYEDRLRWDDPVKQHIPEFELADSTATEETTIGDLATHQAGLPSVLGGFFNPDRTIADVIKELRSCQPQPGHRKGFKYSNVGFALAGEIIARVSVSDWEMFVHKRLLDPVGMTATYTSTTDFLNRTGPPDRHRNMYFPAIKQRGVVQPEPWDKVRCDQVYAPAGGVLSNGSDLARWMQLLADGGRFKGSEIVPQKVIEDVWTRRVEVDHLSGVFDHPFAQVGYGLGWATFEHGGHRVVEHGGGWMSSVIAVVPDAHISVGVFTNAHFFERNPFESVFLASAIKLHALDVLLNLEPEDWSEKFEAALNGV